MSKVLLSTPLVRGGGDSGAGAAVSLSARALVRGLCLCMALLGAVVALGSVVPIASAATGFDRVGGFFETPADGLPSHNKRIAVEHSTGFVFKTDTVLDQVVVYWPTPDGVTELTTFGSGELTDPFGIAIDQGDGDVYVSDDDEVVRYVSDGAPVPTYTKDASFTLSVTGALAFDQANHELLVADQASGTIRRFDTAGVEGAAFDGSAGVGSPGPFATLQDLAVDSTGDVIVVDSTGDPYVGSGESHVYRYSGLGDYEQTLGPVYGAATVAIRPATDEVIVSGNQDAVNRDQDPTVTVFAADASTSDVPVPVQYSSISGMAAGAGAEGQLYVATDAANYHGGFDYGPSNLQVYERAGVHASGPPMVASLPPAADVRAFSATLTGDVDALGFRTSFHFEYAVSGSGHWVAMPEHLKGAGPARASVTGLADDTTYDFRLVATNDAGSTTSSIATFTTLDADPPAVTLDPIHVTIDGAGLQGTVNAQGHPTVYRFEYSSDGGSSWTKLAGPDGNPSVDDSAGAGTTPTVKQGSLGGASLNGTYAVRLVATNGAGATASAEQTFRLTAAVDPTVLSASSVSLTGAVDTHGLVGSYRFSVIQIDGPYAEQTDPVGLSAVDGPQTLAVRSLSNLPKGGSYQVQLTVISGGHTRTGDPIAFTTPVGSYVPALRPPTDDLLAYLRPAPERPTPPNPTPQPPKPSNRFTSKIAIAGQKATVTIALPAAGMVTVKGKGLATVTKRATGKGTVRLHTQLTNAGRKALQTAHDRRLTVPVTVRYTPSGGSSRTITKTIIFKRGSSR